jgi:TRAP transporter TAXI family solute receptor
MKVSGRKNLAIYLVVSLVAFSFSAVPYGALAASGDILGIGTTPSGGLFHIIGSGIAKVVSDYSPLKLTIRPYSGTAIYMPLTNAGELEFGIVHGDDAYRAFKGITPHLRKNTNIRILCIGSPLISGLIVKKDSPIRRVVGVKGKRLPGHFTGALGAKANVEAILASAGLGWDDVKIVPITTAVESLRVLIEGRAEVGYQSLGAGIVREADARLGGIRFLPIDSSPEGLKRMHRLMPGAYAYNAKAGSSTGVVEDTPLHAVDLYLSTHKDLPDDAVNQVLTVLWEHNSDLAKIHPIFKKWTTAGMAKATATIPFHPGAISFFKRKGIWTKEVEDAQKGLLDK